MFSGLKHLNCSWMCFVEYYLSNSWYRMIEKISMQSLCHSTLSRWRKVKTLFKFKHPLDLSILLTGTIIMTAGAVLLVNQLSLTIASTKITNVFYNCEKRIGRIGGFLFWLRVQHVTDRGILLVDNVSFNRTSLCDE